MLAGRQAIRPPMEQRFWSKVQKTDDHWLWTGVLNSMGYGQIYSTVPGDPRMILTHRYSLRLAGVEIPSGMFVDHICRTPRCCRPDHLRVVTPRVNGLENNDNPWAKNARKTHCGPAHHEFKPETTHWLVTNRGPTRICLVCYCAKHPHTKMRPRTREDAMTERNNG